MSQGKEKRCISQINRRDFLQYGLLGSAIAFASPALACSREGSGLTAITPTARSFELEEVTIAVLQEGMKSGGADGTLDCGKVSGTNRRDR